MRWRYQARAPLCDVISLSEAEGVEMKTLLTVDKKKPATPKHSVTAYVILFPWIATGTPKMNEQ
jgi:hypothetical protein